MDCNTCNIPDINCYEQCKEEENKCKGCFGASFGDCENCDERNEEET